MEVRLGVYQCHSLRYEALMQAHQSFDRIDLIGRILTYSDQIDFGLA